MVKPPLRFGLVLKNSCAYKTKYYWFSPWRYGLVVKRLSRKQEILGSIPSGALNITSSHENQISLQKQNNIVKLAQKISRRNCFVVKRLCGKKKQEMVGSVPGGSTLL